MAPFIYEMRTYRVDDGRMVDELVRGLDCVLSRDEGGTGLFERFAIPRPVGLWRLFTGPHLPAVLFLYRWPSVAARAKAFEAFYEDPEWQALRATSNGGTEIVDRMDDVLLTGPPPGALPADATFEFVRGPEPAGPPPVIGPLRPLCGTTGATLSIHALAPGAGHSPIADRYRLLGRLVPVEPRR
jgi:hypothetical protein